MLSDGPEFGIWQAGTGPCAGLISGCAVRWPLSLAPGRPGQGLGEIKDGCCVGCCQIVCELAPGRSGTGFW